MLKRRRVELVPGEPGNSVTIPIPMVDRGRGDPRNIMGLVVEKRDNETYKLATKAGVCTAWMVYKKPV